MRTVRVQRRKALRLLIASSLLSLACGVGRAATLTQAPFGTLSDGRSVTRFTMTAANGVAVSFMSYGSAITDVVTPDLKGRPGHVVLGFTSLREYETIGARNELYFGAVLGRYANWIDRGRFTLDGRQYRLTLSDPPNTIHGGRIGFDKRLWAVTPGKTEGRGVDATLTYVSPDGEQGYPGTLRVSVTYSLADDGTFTIGYRATTDRPTILNLSNHMNFNLAGAGTPGGVLGHVLTVAADRYLPLDREQLPLGRRDPVAGTPFDFRSPKAIGARVHAADPQLAMAAGYDQYWILNGNGTSGRLRQAVHAVDPVSGRTLDCLTTEPGVQIYTGGFFGGSVVGIGGRYGRYAGFTLETGHYPDSPNHPDFPSTVLRPGGVFTSTTVLRFGVQHGPDHFAPTIPAKGV